MSVLKTGTVPISVAGYILNVVAPTAILVLPGTQLAPTLAAGNTQVTVNFDTTYTLGTGTFVQYDLRYSTVADLSSGVTTLIALTSPYVILSLTNSTPYYVQTRPVTTAGAAASWSNISTATPTAGATVPAQMAIPQVSAGNTTVTVDMAEGTYNGGSVITSEDIQHGPNESTWTLISGASDPYTVLGLANSTPRAFQTRSRNSIGAGLWSSTVWATPVAPIGNGPSTPNATVSTLTELNNLLTAWSGSGWNATSAGLGLSNTAPRYIACNTGFYGALSISAKSFGARVYIQSTNWATLGAKFSQITISGTNNVTFQYLALDRLGLGRGSGYTVSTSSNIEICYGKISNDFAGTQSGSSYGVYASNNSSNCAVFDNLIQQWSKGTFYEGVSGGRIYNNFFDQQSGDHMIAYNCTNHQVTNNWFGDYLNHYAGTPTYNPPYYDSDHLDMSQHFGSNTKDAFVFEGNIGWALQILPFASYGYTGVQGSFNEAGSCTNSVWRNNFICAHVHQITFPGGAGNTVEKNTLLYPTGYPAAVTYGAYINASASITTGKNICTAPSFMTDAAAGTVGGLKLGVSSSSNLSVLNPYFANASVNFVAGHTSTVLNDIRPVTGSQAHWAHSNPMGNYERLQAIFTTGAHLGNSLNPVLAARWRTYYDPQFLVA